MAENSYLNQYVKVRGRFHRSVQLKLDISEKKSLNEYILTPTAQELTIQISEGAFSPQGPKAWSIIGPYGTGKSAFSLFLVDYFCSEKPLHPKGVILKKQHLINKKPLVPIILSGHRSKLNKELLKGLSESFFNLDIDLARKASTTSNQECINDNDVIDLILEANNWAKTSGYGGLLIVIDEFGKFLEYAALNPEGEDVFTLQDLAELAERSNPTIILITILHTAFTEYLHSMDRSQQVEWQKVQGRFTNAPFLEPQEQLIHLLGTAIESSFSPDIIDQYQQKVKRVITDETLDEVNRRLHLADLLPACIPLHPITTLVLPSLFRSKLTQNERSLFAFLTSKETYGFQDFLATTKINGANIPFYKLDTLYDYVINALGSSVFIGDRSHRWAGIESAIQRLPINSPALSTSLLKVIGLLGLYGAQIGLRPSRNTLYLVFDDKENVDEALEFLVKTSIIIFRKHEDAFGLWEGSDVNIDEVVETAKTRVGNGSIAIRLKEIVNLRPVVAKAHYIRSGALRYFKVDVIDGTESNLKSSLTTELQLANGSITFVLTNSTHDRQRLIELAKNLTENSDVLRIYAFPRPLIGLENSIQEVEIWRWINENIKALQGDPIARQEVRSQIIYARDRLTQVAGQVLHLIGFQFTPQASEWIQSGELQSINSDTEFQKWLSSLLDTAYSKSPELKNELINRDELSSSAAAARRNLLSAMIEHENENDLAFRGNPAEFSIYLALLKKGGFHQKFNGGFRFNTPETDWKPVWEKINEILIASIGGRQPIKLLFEELRKQPIGLKFGPMPIILCAYLLSKRNQVALYENGVFVPYLRIELFERLMRVPDAFEIQLYEIDQKTVQTLQGIFSILKSLKLTNPGEGNESQSLLLIVKPLVMFSTRLPTFTKKTKRIEPTNALAVRDALNRASDPYSLIFKDLPSIFDITLDNPESIQKFFLRLSDCISALQRAYPLMLDGLEQQIRSAFGLEGKSKTSRQQLCLRAKPLVNYATDRNLGLFIREAARLDNDNRDWREIIGRAINQGIPTDQWTDLLLVDFQVRVLQIAADFIRLEELVAEQSGQGNTKIIRIGILDNGLEQERAIITVQKNKLTEIISFADKVSDFLEQNMGKDYQDQEYKLAILAKLVEDLIKRKNSGKIE